MEGFGYFDWKNSSRYYLSQIRDWKDRKPRRNGREYGQSGHALHHFFLFGAIIAEVVGSITVILGYYARLGAVLILIFLIPTILIFQNGFVDPKLMTHLMKDVSIFGGFLCLLSVGAGRYSLDHFLRGKGEREENDV